MEAHVQTRRDIPGGHHTPHQDVLRQILLGEAAQDAVSWEKPAHRGGAAGGAGRRQAGRPSSCAPSLVSFCWDIRLGSKVGPMGQIRDVFRSDF